MYSKEQMLTYLNRAVMLCQRLTELSEDYWEAAFDADPEGVTVRVKCAAYDAKAIERELRWIQDFNGAGGGLERSMVNEAGESETDAASDTAEGEPLVYFTLRCPWISLVVAEEEPRLAATAG